MLYFLCQLIAFTWAVHKDKPFQYLEDFSKISPGCPQDVPTSININLHSILNGLSEHFKKMVLCGLVVAHHHHYILVLIVKFLVWESKEKEIVRRRDTQSISISLSTDPRLRVQIVKLFLKINKLYIGPNLCLTLDFMVSILSLC